MAERRPPRLVLLVAGPLVIGLLALWTTPALAHKLKVFATASGPVIEGSVYFAGGSAAAGAVVRIEAPPGAAPIEIVADQAGKFSLQVRVRVDHLIIADAGDGHTARVTLGQALLPESLPAVAAPAPAGGALPVDPGRLRDTIAEVVANQIRPLREELNAYRDEVRLRDVLGGFGWIIGLAGIALWARAHRRGAGG